MTVLGVITHNQSGTVALFSFVTQLPLRGVKKTRQELLRPLQKYGDVATNKRSLLRLW
ncbi:hypothetical protein C7M27_04304 (plasmid) [Bacillus subtilis]|nr:hypothetical protein C7M27_04304 [Bacillus subtilis]